jgi:two-component system sensor histidine kinase HydH
VLRDGRVTHLLAVGGKDITEGDMVALRLFAAQIGAAIRMRELHDALLQRERLAAIGEMAAVMAHEIRNPLGVFFNAVSGLRRLVHGPVEAKGLLAVAWEEAERLKRLVADLLEFARPHAPCLEVVDLAPVVEAAAAVVQRDPALQYAGTALLEVRVEEGLPPVQADAARLHWALVNLLMNAFQHVPPEGRVRISAERAGDGEVRLSVHNDGPPIASDVAPRIFDPFFTTRATGTGLGLAVVRRIVKDLGGRIALDSNDVGVSFSVWLKSRQTEPPPTAATGAAR